MNRCMTWLEIVLLTFVLLLMLNVPECEAEWSVDTLITSQHMDQKPEHNRNHQGIGVSYSTGKTTYSYMTYSNSFHNRSHMISVLVDVLSWKSVDVSVGAAIASGYEYASIAPAILSTVSYSHTNHISSKIYIIPTEVVAYGISYRF